MANFDINTNFNMLNTLKDFNFNANFNTAFNTDYSKSFNVDGTDNLNTEFSDILNGIQTASDNSAKNISATEKMAQDIGFGFKEGLENLSAVNKKAETDFETFASGGDISIHEVMISSQKSSLAMQMALQLRTQMLNAYNEFKNMQV